LVLTFASIQSAAFAQAPPQPPAPIATSTTQQALAQTLFDQAKKLMSDGRYPEACAKFADSNRLAPGTGTLLNLATCHVKIGKLTTAWLELNDAADSDRREGNTQRLEWIRSQIAELEPQLDYLTVQVPPAMPSGFAVTLDDVKIDSSAWNTATPLDPGEHVVRATAPGYDDWSKKIVVTGTAQKQTIEVPLLNEHVAAQQTPVVAPPPKSADVPKTDDSPSIDKTRRNVAYVLGGTAVAGLAVGTIFGVKTLSDWSDRNDNCPGGKCNQAAVDDYSSAKTAAIVSDVSFGVAVVAAAAGTYLFVTSKHRSSSVTVGGAPLPGGGVASLSARF
jgi:hypothetical protein